MNECQCLGYNWIRFEGEGMCCKGGKVTSIVEGIMWLMWAEWHGGSLACESDGLRPWKFWGISISVFVVWELEKGAEN
jgi:hypothetical protein